MTPIKLVALDLDGTLVNENLKISDRTQTLLQGLIQQDEVKVVVATGRMYPSAQIFTRQLGVTAPIVAYQGAMVREAAGDENVILHQPIEAEDAKVILDYLHQQDCHVNVYVADQVYTSCNSRFKEFYARTAGVDPIYREDLSELLAHNPTKMMAVDEDGSITDRILNHLTEIFPPERLATCKSRFNFCEIIHGQASKWNAVNHLAQQWGIQPQEILAIGDHGNDVSMISQAGIGVAMGNAPDFVKQKARYVTGTIEQDGAALAIEQFVLGKTHPEVKLFNRHASSVAV